MSRYRGISNKLIKFLPPTQKMKVRNFYAQRKFENFMRTRLGHYYVNPHPGPVGDMEIVKRTAIMHEHQIAERASVNYYFMTGYGTMLEWLKLAESHGLNLRTVSSIMEFGCGSARLIRHLRCMDGVRLVGTDLQQDFIEWCKFNVPGVEFYTNDLTPPLAFAEPNSFDLVFAQSVFTHIPLDTQDAWIAEMCRILEPGGLFIGTVLGRPHAKAMLTEAQWNALQTKGHFVLHATDPQASYSTQLIDSWDVFQTRREVLRVFGAHFEVLDYLPRGLDVLVLRKSQHC